jgi:DNA-binding transcriptional regulator GbsR (MarR family)
LEHPHREQPFEQTHFIEEVGLMFELVGLPRMAGRIFGWLLISDPPWQSSSELADTLQASKGSISTMTRLLIQLSLIEKVSFPGDRRDYFQIKPNSWKHMTEQRLAQITAFRQLAERGLEMMENTAPHLRGRLQEMRDIHAFWERELPRLNRQWEEEHLKTQHSEFHPQN